MKAFNFNRQLHLDHFAKIDELKEAKRADYYKNREAGLKAYITVLKKQIKLGNNGSDNNRNRQL